MTFDEMTDRIATGQGFIAALDQSGGSTPKALRGYGVEDSEWSGDEEMFGKIHEMRSRIIETPCFGNGKVIGAILFAAFDAYQIRLQQLSGGAIPYQIFLMLPYALSILALIVVARRATYPKALMIPYQKGER